MSRSDIGQSSFVQYKDLYKRNVPRSFSENLLILYGNMNVFEQALH